MEKTFVGLTESSRFSSNGAVLRVSPNNMSGMYLHTVRAVRIRTVIRFSLLWL